MIPLGWYLIFSAALFSIGLFGVLARRNVIIMLMGVELMLNAVNVNVLALWRYVNPMNVNGLVFTLIIFAVAAAEAAVGLAIIISVFRRRKTVISEDINLLKW